MLYALNEVEVFFEAVRQGAQPTLFQYRLTIALLCFALSTVAGLLFAAKVQISGTIGVLSVTSGGTAALRLGALLGFNYAFAESSLTKVREYDLRLNERRR